MFAELLGKEAGYCQGKGGSMHIADPDTGNLGANAIVGGSAGIATGAAFSAKRSATDRSRSASSATARSARACSTKSMNMAALWKLPVIYVCENNLYNEYTHYTETTAGEILARAAGFGHACRERRWPGRARGLRHGASSIVERARAAGPASCCATPIAIHGHHVGDVNRDYYRAQDRKSRSGGPTAIRSQLWPIG